MRRESPTQNNFFNLEKRTTNIKSINRLELSDGSITEDPDIILQEMKKILLDTLFFNNE